MGRQRNNIPQKRFNKDEGGRQNEIPQCNLERSARNHLIPCSKYHNYKDWNIESHRQKIVTINPIRVTIMAIKNNSGT